MIISIPGIVSQGGGLPAKGKPLNDYTWDEISLISQAGKAAEYWSVGDRKAVALKGSVGGFLTLNGTYYCYILGFDHNSSVEGANKIHFQFGFDSLSGGTHIAFVDSKFHSTIYASNANGLSMYKTSSNTGGWVSSILRTAICPAFKATMPTDLQAVLRKVTKYSDNKGGKTDTASNVTSTEDEIFIPSEFEYFGTRKYANSAEQNYQKRYAYYAAGNSSVFKYHSNTSSNAGSLTRSVNATSKTDFCYVNETLGTANTYSANVSGGFAPCFCV